MHPPCLLIAALTLATLLGAQPQSEPLLIVEHGRYGYVDHHGQVVIPPYLYWASDFENGFAEAYVCGRLVLIDRHGTVRPHPGARPGEVVAPKRLGAKVGLVDANGRVLIEPTYDDALPFSEGLSAVEIGRKWGYIDYQGRLVISAKFDSASNFVEGVAVAQLEDQSVLINRRGEVVVAGFDPLLNIAEGRVLASRRNEGWGFVNFTGRIAVPFVYEHIRNGFHAGLAAVAKGGKWGYIDRYGTVVIPLQFDEAAPFHVADLAFAKRGGQSGFIDRTGAFRVLLPGIETEGLVYGDVAPFFTRDNQFGYVDRTGHVLWGPSSEHPDHWPLLGWSEEDEQKSCEGLPDKVRTSVLVSQ